MKEIKVLDQEVARPDFWNDNESAQRVLQKRAGCQRPIELWRSLNQQSEDVDVMISLTEEESDDSLEAEIHSALEVLESALDQAELQAMLSGDKDASNAILSVNAGAGGTESQDWTQMLLRMYTRWGERRGYKTEILHMQYGEEAGIKSATLMFNGDYAFGYLKAEIGVHRLVRISPFDANKRRHTSFASVFVYPSIFVYLRCIDRPICSHAKIKYFLTDSLWKNKDNGEDYLMSVQNKQEKARRQKEVQV